MGDTSTNESEIRKQLQKLCIHDYGDEFKQFLMPQFFEDRLVEYISDLQREARIEELERQQGTAWAADKLYHGKGLINVNTIIKVNQDRINELKGNGK